MFVIISKSHFTLVVLKPNFSFKNGTKNGQIVLSFFIRNSCTRFNLVSTLLPSLQKKWYSAFSLPPLTSMCYIVLPFVHFIKSVAVDSPSSHPSFLLPHCYCVYIFFGGWGARGMTLPKLFLFLQSRCGLG